MANLTGTAGRDTLTGGVNDDNIDGMQGDDVLSGNAGNDVLVGGAGVDWLSGGDGVDSLLGGDGDDTVYFGRASRTAANVEPGDTFDGGAGYDTLSVGGGADLSGVNITSIEFLKGGAGYDLRLTLAQLDAFQAITGEFIITDGGAVSFSGATVRSKSIFHLSDLGTVFDLTDVVLDTIYGRDGVEVRGGAGQDVITATGSWDQVYGGGGDDVLEGGGSYDILNGGDGNDAIGGGAHFDALYGGRGTDALSGGDGSDELFLDSRDGMSGETYDGGEGEDTLYLQVGTAALDISGVTLTSIETLEGLSVSEVSLRADQLEGLTTISLEKARLTTGGTISLLGKRTTVEEFFLYEDDTVFSLEGVVTQNQYLKVWGGAGRDTLSGATRQINTLIGGGGDDVVTGGDASNSLFGGVGNDRLIGGTRADHLDGGAGDDIIEGGTGDDVIVGGLGIDVVSYASATGSVEIDLGVSVTGGAAGVDDLNTVENLVGSAHADVLAGDARINRLEGGDGGDALAGGGGDDLLEGGAGADRIGGDEGIDTLRGGTGNDTYVLTDRLDRLIESEGEGVDTVEAPFSWTLRGLLENITLTGTAKANATGNAVANVLEGNIAGNLLDGGLGGDTMYGEAGNDTYVVDDAQDEVIERMASGGADLVRSSVTFALGANVENLLLTGSGAIGGTGNASANSIIGNRAANMLKGEGGADILDGGLGGDSMSGGTEDDTYILDDVADKVIELAAGGSGDTVQSSVSYVLGANIERLTLTGSSAIAGTGNALANLILGNGSANALDGKLGADEMRGGAGDDSYFFDNVGDRAIEGSGAGKDAVVSSVSARLDANLETLTLVGRGGINGTGNSLANLIVGNLNNNMLDGAAGADRMEGATGNDTYRVDNADDAVIEASGGGIDTVFSTVNYVLARNVEGLALAGGARLAGTGNELANTIVGNGNNNVLDGRAGADRMQGGAGNDVYHFDSANDAAIEAVGAGSDAVISSVTLTLAANLEQLTLAGVARVDGRGNALANGIVGNTNNNLIAGLAGTDVLDGGAGNDSLRGGADMDALTGGGGADRFCFDAQLGADNVDRIEDFVAAADTIELDRTVFARISANGTLAASAFHVGARAADAIDRIVYDQASGRIFYDADGNGAGAAVLFARVEAGTVLTNADFFAVG